MYTFLKNILPPFSGSQFEPNSKTAETGYKLTSAFHLSIGFLLGSHFDLKMEVMYYSETSGYLLTTCHYNTGDSALYSQHCEIHKQFTSRVGNRCRCGQMFFTKYQRFSHQIKLFPTMRHVEMNPIYITTGNTCIVCITAHLKYQRFPGSQT